jgi:hypothetical protein
MKCVLLTALLLLCIPTAMRAAPPPGLEQPMVEVKAGESIRNALDRLPAEGGVCRLLKGTHMIRESIALRHGVTFEGEGVGSTLKLAPGANVPLLVNATEDMHDVTIRNLVIDGGLQPTEQKYGREHHAQRDKYKDVGRKQVFGILFTSYKKGPIKGIRLERVTITGCAMGCHIKGAEGVTLTQCLFAGNGAIEAFFHNVYLRRDKVVRIDHCVFRDSPTGNGFNGSYMEDVEVTNCLASGNHFRGIRFAETKGIVIRDCIARKNGNAGLIINSEKKGCRTFALIGNVSERNGANGIEIRSAGGGELRDNLSVDNKEQDYYFRLANNVVVRSNRGQRIRIDRCGRIQREGNQFDAETPPKAAARPVDGLAERLLREAGAM